MHRDAGSTFGAFVLACVLAVGVAAGLRYGLGEAPAACAAVGGGVWLLVFVTRVLAARRARGLPATGGRITEGDTTAETVARSESVQWARRAEAAARRLAGHAQAGPELGEAAARARSAAEQLAARAEAVAAIDTATGPDGPDARELRAQQAQLRREAEALPEGGTLRRTKEASARALGERAASRARMEEFRAVHIATLESLALGLEAAAEHAGVLVSARAASEAAAPLVDLTPLHQELQAVRAGLEQLEEITRSVVGGE